MDWSYMLMDFIWSRETLYCMLLTTLPWWWVSGCYWHSWSGMADDIMFIPSKLQTYLPWWWVPVWVVISLLWTLITSSCPTWVLSCVLGRVSLQVLPITPTYSVTTIIINEYNTTVSVALLQSKIVYSTKKLPPFKDNPIYCIAVLYNHSLKFCTTWFYSTNNFPSQK